ncbi:MAG: hypothetical protein AB1778_07940, partial [Candidatus Bipolaricaulota bacterium]
MPWTAVSEEAFWIRAGRMSYSMALEVQKGLHALRVSGRIPDVVMTVEHDPVFTCGRRSRADSFLASAEQIRAAGIEVYETDRGGGVTYHGPGQVVEYPVVDLRRCGRDL